jgi:hypothetical protein
MKIAFLLCGQPRTMEYCAPSVKSKILDVYHPDVFISTTEQGDRIKELFRPVDIGVHGDEETSRILGDKAKKYTNKPPEAKPENDLAITWRFCEAIGLKKQAELSSGKPYDLVVFGRFDIKLRFLQRLQLPQENTLYIPQTDAYLMRADKDGHHWGGYATQFFWCSSRTANYLGELYDLTDTYYQETGYWHSEHMVKWWCERFGIRPQLVQIHMLIIRGTLEHPVSVHGKSLDFYQGF